MYNELKGGHFMKTTDWIGRFKKSKRYESKAEAILKDDEKVEDLVEQVMEKARKKNELNNLLDQLNLLVSMIKDYVKGNYKEVPKVTIIIGIASFVYFISPLDFNPDFLPIGLLDDAAILGFFLKSFSSDLELYSTWKTAKDELEE
jgi:uncharacterized membrane protein YkvA (DUF1232 family)